MEKNIQTTIMGYIGITIKIHPFITSQPKVSSEAASEGCCPPSEVPVEGCDRS